MITENLSTLKINKLTQEQYDREREAGRIDENAMYLTTNEEITAEQIGAVTQKALNDTLSSYVLKIDFGSLLDDNMEHITESVISALPIYNGEVVE